MPVFKTTLKIESTNSANNPVDFTSTNNTDLTDNVVFGKITVNADSSTIIKPNDYNPGAKGSFIYIKSTASNPNHTAIIINTDKGKIATLYPGEYSLIPLSNDIYELEIITTFGTAELEYFFGSRGEEIGESVLYVWKDEDTATWKFFTMDVATGTPGELIDTGFDYFDWPSVNSAGFVNRKGYILDFYNNGNNRHNLHFVNSQGHQILTTPIGGAGFSYEIPQSYNSWYGSGRANIITWYDGTDGHLIYFDGDNIYKHDFLDIVDIYVENNWDACTSDGTFPIYIEGLNGNSYLEGLFFVKGSVKNLIKTTHFEDFYYTNSYAYSYANFIAVETKYSNSSPEGVVSVEIFNTDGALLKSVDFNNTPMNTYDYYFYGTGKLQIVYRKNDNNQYIFLNYNQLTGKLIGEDLNWTSDYNNYEVVSNSYYTGGGNNYRAESVAIIKYYNDGNDSNYLLNQDTDGDLEVTYIINNDTEWRNYVVPSTEDRYFVSNAWNNNNHATDKDFILLSTDNRTSGALVATRFTSGAEPIRFNLINNLSAYSNSGSVYCFGDYRYLSIRTADESVREFIVFDSKVLDKVSADNWDSNTQFNTLIVVDYDLNKEWYFNTSTKKWTLLPTYTDGDWWTNYAEGDQLLLGTGKILLLRAQNNTTSESYHGRMITRGVAGNERELLKVGNVSNWDLYMSTETVVLFYKENSNSTWKVRVFDLNLNFLYEVDTKKQSINSNVIVGKVNSTRLTNNYSNFTFYNFNKLLNVKEIYNPNSSFWTYANNYGWD